MLAAGEAGRVVATVPMNLMIFDDRAALFTLTTETGDTTVYVFAHWDLIAIMKSSLEHFWEHGENLRTALRKSSAPESSARGGKEIAHGEDKE
jgi:hypothetical protein